MTVVAEMMDSLINISSSTKYNFIQLDKVILDIRKQLNDTRSAFNELKFINVYNLFLHNFEMLYVRLDEIETAIAFSKLGTLHQSIIDTNELLSLFKTIEIKNRLVFPATLDNIFKLEQCIKLKVYAKENQITFILDIPLVEPDKYSYYRIIPLPITNSINQTSLVLPKYPYLLMKGLKAVSMLRPCREIDESLFLCDEDYSPLMIKDACVIELMSFAINTTECHPISVEFDDVKIEKIQTDRWILYTKSTLLITKSCENEITHHHICGTYIITADDDCEATIKDITLRRHQGNLERISIPALPVINLPEILPLITSPLESRPTNLDGVDLLNLQHLSHVLAKSESVSVKSENESVINVKDMSIGTLVLYVLLIIVFLFYCKKFVYRFIRNSQDEVNSPDNFELTVGEVMHSGIRQDIVTIHA